MKTVEEIKNKIFNGDSFEVLKDFPSNTVDLVVTSPPYYNLRNYQHKGQIGMEKTPQDYIANLIQIFRECKRVLKKTGSIWVNISDSYSTHASSSKTSHHNFYSQQSALDNGIGTIQKASLKNMPEKTLIGIPERFVIAMQDELGLIRRNTIIWHKPSCMPSSAKDRFTIDFEYFYFFTKEENYYFETQYEPMKSIGQSDGMDRQMKFGEYKGTPKKDYEGNGVQNPSDIKKRMMESFRKRKFGGSKETGKYASNQEQVTNRTYSGNEWIPNENFERIKRTVWSINTPNSVENHFATYPEQLIEIPIKACTNITDKTLVLDPFLGSGTTAIKAQKLGRGYVGIELNSSYVSIAKRRLNNMITSYIVRE